MTRRVVLVSDSTSVDADLAKRYDIAVVPLQVAVDGRAHDEGVDIEPQQVADALREGKRVSTSRPAPERFAEVYRAAVAAGAEGVVSIHLSSEVSGTYEAALLAARQVEIDVEVVDSRHLGMGTGFAVAAAATALDDDASAAEAAEVARARAAVTTGLFYVDTLEYLRRGGRVSLAAAFVGSALAVKPLLKIDNGRIVQLDKVRTSGRALVRLEELAVQAAGSAGVDLAVSHLDNQEHADTLAWRLRDRLPGAGEIVVNEVGAVIGAHAGPGIVAVVIAPS